MEATGFGWYAWLERDDDLEGEEKSNTKRSWYSYWLITKRCLSYCRPQAGTVALLLIIITVKALVGLLNPLLFQQMIDETLPSMDLWKFTGWECKCCLPLCQVDYWMSGSRDL